MDLLLGGSLIAAGLLLLRRASRVLGETKANAPSPVTAPSAPQSAATPAVEEVSTNTEAPSGSTAPSSEYEQLIEKIGLQAFVVRINTEPDPNSKEDMKFALVDYYREKVNPNDHASSDTQILTTLGVKLPQRVDVAPKGTTVGEDIIDISKSKVWNKYTQLSSDIEAQEKMLDEYRQKLQAVYNNRELLMKDGSYEANLKKAQEDVDSCTKRLNELKAEREKIKPQYDAEQEMRKKKEEEEKKRAEEEKRRLKRQFNTAPRDIHKIDRNGGYIRPNGEEPTMYEAMDKHEDPHYDTIDKHKGPHKPIEGLG